MKKLLIFALVIFISGCSTEIDGSSPARAALSFNKILKEHATTEEMVLFTEGLSRIAMLSYAKANPSFTKTEYENMYKNNDAQSIVRNFSSDPAYFDDLIKEMDGMDFDDVIDAGNDANEELKEILSERPVTVAIAPPIQTEPETIKSVPVESNVAAPVVPTTQTVE